MMMPFSKKPSIHLAFSFPDIITSPKIISVGWSGKATILLIYKRRHGYSQPVQYLEGCVIISTGEIDYWIWRRHLTSPREQAYSHTGEIGGSPYNMQRFGWPYSQ
jgi:hypothetical protein